MKINTLKRTFELIAVAGAIIGTSLLAGCKKTDGPVDPLSGRSFVVYGKIFTADPSESIVDAFVVKDGKFVYVGSKSGAAEYVTSGMSVIDYTGKGLVIPGCTEGHGHFIGIDGIARMLPGYLSSYADLIGKVIPEKMKAAPGPFLSFGWPTEELQKLSDRDYAMEIEAVSAGFPVVLFDGSGHNAVCNRTALKKAGLINDQGEKIKDIRGGEVIAVLDKNGNPTDIASGYVTDEVVFYVTETAIGALLDDEGYRQACLNAVKELNKRGFTSYLDAYINALDDAQSYKYLAELDRRGELTANVMGYYTIRSYDWGLPKGGPIPGTVTDKLKKVGSFAQDYTKGHIIANGVKLFSDGVVETYTGWISGEYTVEGLPEDKKHGNIIWEQEELDAIVSAANAKGFPVHTHTFGDMACNAVINAYSSSPSAKSLAVRNSLAHVRNISKDDITRCAANNIGIASNLIWHMGDPLLYRMYFLSIMPEEIYENGYPMKSLLNAGIVVSSSTDAPCGESVIGTVPNIIGASVNGLSPDYLDVDPLNPDELLTVREVLKCLTVGGASSLGLEKERGSIEVGKYADFVVLDKDVLELEAQDKCKDIFQVNVEGTWFEGRQVYRK